MTTQTTPETFNLEVTEATPLVSRDASALKSEEGVDDDEQRTSTMAGVLAEATQANPPVMGSPKRPRPWFGYLMFWGCVAGFIVSIAKGGGIAPVDINPMIGPTAAALVSCGAKVTSLIVDNGEWWRLISPMWLHAGLIHIGTNMNMLYRLGFAFERGIGTPRFAFIYLVSGIVSMVYSAVFSPQSVTVGASGALFGILGAMLGEMSQNCHLLSARDRCCGFTMLLVTIVINLAVGLLPFVDNFAHFFGCISGLLLGLTVIMYRDKRGYLKFRQVAISVFAGAGFLVFALIGFAILFTGVNALETCPWCKYISCVPSPWWSCDAVPAAASGGSGNSTRLS